MQKKKLRLLLLGNGSAEGILHLGALLLGSGDVAQTLVAELQGTLFLADAQQLLHALLQRGVSNELADDGLDGAQLLLGQAEAGLAGDGAGALRQLVALVEASNDAGLGSTHTGGLALVRRHPADGFDV